MVKSGKVKSLQIGDKPGWKRRMFFILMVLLSA
jgi:hypothetical protein